MSWKMGSSPPRIRKILWGLDIQELLSSSWRVKSNRNAEGASSQRGEKTEEMCELSEQIRVREYFLQLYSSYPENRLRATRSLLLIAETDLRYRESIKLNLKQFPTN